MKIQIHIMTCLLLLLGVAPGSSSQAITMRAPFAEAVKGATPIFQNAGQKALDVPALNAAGCSRTRCADLDVTYIERTPRYPRYALDYRLRPGDPWRIPRLCEGTEDAKHWPD